MAQELSNKRYGETKAGKAVSVCRGRGHRRHHWGGHMQTKTWKRRESEREPWGYPRASSRWGQRQPTGFFLSLSPSHRKPSIFESPSRPLEQADPQGLQWSGEMVQVLIFFSWFLPSILHLSFSSTRYHKWAASPGNARTLPRHQLSKHNPSPADAGTGSPGWPEGLAWRRGRKSWLAHGISAPHLPKTQQNPPAQELPFLK